MGNEQNMKPVQNCKGSYFVHFARLNIFRNLSLLVSVFCDTIYVRKSFKLAYVSRLHDMYTYSTNVRFLVETRQPKDNLRQLLLKK